MMLQYTMHWPCEPVDGKDALVGNVLLVVVVVVDGSVLPLLDDDELALTDDIEVGVLG